MSDGCAPARSRAHSIGISIACALSLAGCAAGPALQTTRIGALPPQGSSEIVRSDDRPEPAWDQLVDQRLQAQGFSPGEDPRYLPGRFGYQCLYGAIGQIPALATIGKSMLLMELLHLDSSIMGEASASRTISATVVDRIRATHAYRP